MALVAVSDEEMSSDRRYPSETKLALLERDIKDILKILNGDGGGQKGLVTKVDELTEVSERGRWSLKIALWVGGAVVGLLTLAAQLKALIFGAAPPGH